MRNIQVETKAGKLHITVDVTPKTVKESPMSNSGKNKLVASSGGMQPVDGLNGLKFGLNVISK